ncbi:hypothetical protein OAZ81_03645 [Pseudomonadota bacterium]|nr:hypothetical protein [Pseudomonadota bacterium]
MPFVYVASERESPSDTVNPYATLELPSKSIVNEFLSPLSSQSSRIWLKDFIVSLSCSLIKPT